MWEIVGWIFAGLFAGLYLFERKLGKMMAASIAFWQREAEENLDYITAILNQDSIEKARILFSGVANKRLKDPKWNKEVLQ